MKKRLSKQERREQLFAVALEIIRSEGADALTLGHLAAKAGVTKPVTYGHFEHRQGLLEQLYQDLDERLIHSMNQALGQGSHTLAARANVVCGAYIDCMVSVGPVYDAIVAALQGYPPHSDIQERIRNYFIDAYRQIFTPYLPSSVEEATTYLAAIHGAIEAVGNRVVREQITKERALLALVNMIVKLLAVEPMVEPE